MVPPFFNICIGGLAFNSYNISDTVFQFAGNPKYSSNSLYKGSNIVKYTLSTFGLITVVLNVFTPFSILIY